MRPIRSTLYWGECTATYGRLGDAPLYYPAYIEAANGTRVPLLFEREDLTRAMERAEQTPEHVPPHGAQHEFCALPMVWSSAAGAIIALLLSRFLA